MKKWFDFTKVHWEIWNVQIQTQLNSYVGAGEVRTEFKYFGYADFKSSINFMLLLLLLVLSILKNKEKIELRINYILFFISWDNRNHFVLEKTQGANWIQKNQITKWDQNNVNFRV